MTRELYAMLYASKAAEEKIMEIYRAGFEVEIKEDDSPVTLADKTADRIIREILQRDFPDYGFLTEESTDDRSRLKKESIFVVDPVDGHEGFREEKRSVHDEYRMGFQKRSHRRSRQSSFYGRDVFRSEKRRRVLRFSRRKNGKNSRQRQDGSADDAGFQFSYHRRGNIDF